MEKRKRKFAVNFVLLALFVFGLVVAQKSVAQSAESKASLIGIWAMIPLKNGIANVAEFDEAGISKLHPFNCQKQTNEPIQISEYELTNDGKTIQLNTHGEVMDLVVKSVTEKEMVLAQEVLDFSFKFMYLRTDTVAPLCDLYKAAK